MKLSARQKYDYRDPDRGEAQLNFVLMSSGNRVNWLEFAPSTFCLEIPSAP